MVLTSLDKYRDTGLLLLRIGFGLMFIYHGYPKISGGIAGWERLGSLAMPHLGVTFVPAFWGFMAAAAEFLGGILLLLGFFFRPACLLLAMTMATAVTMKFSVGAGLAGAAPALENGIVFLSLILIGPGQYSFDHMFSNSSKQRRGYGRR